MPVGYRRWRGYSNQPGIFQLWHGKRFRLYQGMNCRNQGFVAWNLSTSASFLPSLAPTIDPPIDPRWLAQSAEFSPPIRDWLSRPSNPLNRLQIHRNRPQIRQDSKWRTLGRIIRILEVFLERRAGKRRHKFGLNWIWESCVFFSPYFIGVWRSNQFSGTVIRTQRLRRPPVVNSTNQILLVEFTTNEINNFQGFQASYTSVLILMQSLYFIKRLWYLMGYFLASRRTGSW